MSEERSSGDVTNRPRRKNKYKKKGATASKTGASPTSRKKVNTKLTKGGRRDSTAGFPSLHSASSIRVTKEEKRLGKKASEKFIDVKDNNNNNKNSKKSTSSSPPKRIKNTNGNTDKKNSDKSKKDKSNNDGKSGTGGKKKSRQKTPRRKGKNSTKKSPSNNKNTAWPNGSNRSGRLDYEKLKGYN